MADWRNLVCVTMVIILPASLQSQNPDAAMLHTAGAVQLNGSPAPPSSAIFVDDLLQTSSKAEAKIDVSGSTAVLGPDTLVQFEGTQIFLEHGTVQVTTSTQMAVRVGCITAVPVVAGWTQYGVTDVNGKITVVARKSNVNIETRKAHPPKNDDARYEKATVREGEQASREEKCAAADIRAPGYVAGKTAGLNTWEAKVIGAGLVGTIICFGLCHDDDPVSPYDPSK